MPVVTDEQFISLHTKHGVQLYQFSPSGYTETVWGRKQRDVSTCDITIPPSPGLERLPDIVPWAHWVTVWDGPRNIVLWTGPIFHAKENIKGLTLSVKDHAAYLRKTRVPMTKRWDAADPAWIAGELWDVMLDQKGIRAKALVNSDPEGKRFDYQTRTDTEGLDQTMSALVDLGLRYSVVSGVPIIGPLSLEPLVSLSEKDFVGGDGISLVRDGTDTCNDVVIRNSDTIARAKVEYYGESLQTIKDIDSMSGVSNANKSAYSYLKQTSAVRTRLELEPGTVLHPDAPVSIDELMPSTRFVIEAHGIRQLMELTDVEVTRRAGIAETKVTMELVLTMQEQIDLELDKQIDPPEVSRPGAAAR